MTGRDRPKEGVRFAEEMVSVLLFLDAHGVLHLL